MQTKFEDVVVVKPWGKEFLLYKNTNIGIWILYLNSNCKTSLHCHPNKKTGLAVLDGKVDISFLASKPTTFLPNQKIMIRQGVFHSTFALEDSILLEVETPESKLDLVRIQDSYGRSDKPYESSNSYKLRTWEPFFSEEKEICCGFGKCLLKQTTCFNIGINDNILILKGGIKYKDIYIASSGDILSKESIDILLSQFLLEPNSIGLLISNL